MRRRLLHRRKGTNITYTSATIISSYVFNLGIGGSWLGGRFSRDYTKYFIFTQSSSIPQYILNVVDIANAATWTLRETGPAADFRGGHINNDGTKIYYGINDVRQNNLPTPYSWAGGTFAGSLAFVSLTGATGQTGGADMNPEETKLFVSRYGVAGSLSEYNLSTPGNIAGATFVQEKYVNSTNEKSLSFADSGNKIFTCYNSIVNMRTVTTPYTLNNLSEPTLLSGIAINQDYRAVEVYEDKLYLMRNNGGMDIYQLN